MISANSGEKTAVEKLIEAAPDIIEKVKEYLPKKNEEDSED